MYTDPVTNFVYYLNPCGPLTSTSPCRNGTSVCQVTNANVATTLSVFNPSSVVWSRSPGSTLGVRSTLRDGGWCTSTASPRTVTIDWVCSKTVTTPYFAQMTEISACSFNAVIYTPLACQATVVCNHLSSKFYSGSHCPFIAPQMTLTNPANVFESLDEFSARIPLGIDFHYYGQVYRYMHIDTLGEFSFGAQASNLPNLMPFATDWVLDSVTSVQYSNETVNGTAAVVVRFRDVEFVGSERPGNSDAMSFDVILFAGVEGRVEVRYYVINQPTNAPYVRVGTQNADWDTEEHLQVVDYQVVDAALAASFSNSTLRISYSGPDVTTTPCAGLGYNLSSLQGSDFIFNDTTTRVAYAVRVCGMVTDADCQSSPSTSYSAMCAKRYDDIGQTTGYTSYSEYNPAESYWNYPAGSSTGVQLVTQSGVFCMFGNGFPYITVYNFICDAGATQPQILNVGVTRCTYVVNITTNVVCSAGDRNVPVPPPQSTLTACLPITGIFYNGELCPREVNDPYVLPEPMDNATHVLEGDNNVYLITFPFDFYLYDRIETSVSINTNGLLTFGFQQTESSSPDSFPFIGLSPDNFPVIAPFFTDLVNQDTSDGIIPYQGYIAYQHMGEAPNRRVLIRYFKIDYYSTMDNIAEQSASFDVILTEGEPGGIEIRYYRIDATASQNLVVGMVGYEGNNSYTSVFNNAPVTRAVAGQLQGSTLRFSYTGINQPDVCIGVVGGYNLSSLSNIDMTYSDTSYQYYLHPCGIVTAPVCTSKFSTQRVAVCRASLDGLETSALAGDSPASTTWTVSRGMLTATLTDGMTCPQSDMSMPFRTVIQYACDSNAATPVISALDTSVQCRHTFTVRTAAACVSGNFVGTQPDLGTYDARLYYDPNAVKTVMTNPTVILSASNEADSGKVLVATPFPVYMYGEAFTGMYVNVNGWIAFRSGTATASSSTMPVSSTFATSVPMLVIASADLHNSNKGGNSSISWSVEHQIPNRVFLVRYDQLNYYVRTIYVKTKSYSFPFHLQHAHLCNCLIVDLGNTWCCSIT